MILAVKTKEHQRRNPKTIQKEVIEAAILIDLKEGNRTVWLPNMSTISAEAIKEA